MWLPGPSVLVITGASTGIGFNVVRDLVNAYDGTIYMTGLNETTGNLAVEEIKSRFVNETIPVHRYYTEKIKFFQVDVTDETQVANFTKYITEKHGGVDVLINNAAVNVDHVAHLTKEEQINKTMETNYFGVLRMCHFLFPLLRQHGKVIHVTSHVGHVTQIANGTELRQRFLNDTMKEEELTQLMHQYVEDFRLGRHRKRGWPDSPYTVSKVGVSKLAMVQQWQHCRNVTADITVNAVNPGYAKTAMSNFTGLMPPDEAADPILFLLTMSEFATEPKGRLIWNNKAIQAWNDTPPHTFDHPSLYAKFYK